MEYPKIDPVCDGRADPQELASLGERRCSLPVFVVGCPRSGTTLLSVMLDRHSGLAITPETAFYDEIAPNLPTADEAATRILLAAWSRLPELGLSVDAVIDRIGPVATRPNLLPALLALYAHARGKPRCGEKTPQHLRHTASILADFPDAKVICLLRDGRDVALSLSRMPWWRGGLEGAAAHWLETERRTAELEEAEPVRFLGVRYERLVAGPAAVLTEVMAVVGLGFEAGQLDPEHGSELVLARSLAWKGRALRTVDPGRGAAGRRAASADEIAYLDRVLGPALARRGYAPTAV